MASTWRANHIRQCRYPLLSPSAQALGSAPSPTEDFGRNPSHAVVAGGVSPSTCSCCLCQDPPEFSPAPTMPHLQILRQLSSQTLFIFSPREFDKEKLRLQPCIAHLHLSPADLNWEMPDLALRGVPGTGWAQRIAKPQPHPHRSPIPIAAPALPVPRARCTLPTLPSPAGPGAGRGPTPCSAASCALSRFWLFFSLTVGSVII